jgi:hypothetical protein
MDNSLKSYRKIILSLFLLVSITLSFVTRVNATTPNPGHAFTESSGGIVQGDLIIGTGLDTVAALAKNASATRYLSNTGTNNNPAWALIDLSNGVTGLLPVANGGVGLGPVGDDQILVSDSSAAATWKTVNDCQGAGNALTYSQASNAWGCNSVSAETVTTMGTLITNTTAKTTPIDADMVGLMDSTDGLLKKLSWANIKANLVSTFLSLDNSAASTSILIKDNNGAALNFAEGANSYLGFDTRDGIENVYSLKRHDFFGGATFSTAITARLTPRVGTVASAAEPAINTSSYDVFSITALAADITSMTTNLSGSPTDFEWLIVRIKDDGNSRLISWGVSFVAAGATLPSRTFPGYTTTAHFIYDSAAGTWGCVLSTENRYSLLDGVIHSDTTAGTVARGDVITGQGATAKWTRLAKGTAGQALMMDSSATDVAWAKPLGYKLFVQALASSPADTTVFYFGQIPRAITTTANISKVYVRKAGTITAANVLCQTSGTVGSAENWSMYIRLNSATDTLIATVGVAAAEKVFTKSDLSIAVVAGDYFEIKNVPPAWVTNPTAVICGGYVYIE